jgi:xanthine dehydrogenase accessory factor
VTDDELHRVAAAWLAKGRRAQVVEVLQAQGSTPREQGARMLVSADTSEGTIGGGHLEQQAIEAARAALRHGDESVQERRFALGPALGQCCGGTVLLRSRPLDAHALQDWPRPAARFSLQLHGAGHVGCEIARLLARIDCHVQWVDERETEFPDHPLPTHIETLCSDTPAAEVASAPPGAFYLVLTHSHALDFEIVEAVLKRGDFGFLGLIGSHSKRARFVHRLADKGFDDALLERLVCPIGVPGIAGKQPALVAISAVAQLLQMPATGLAGSEA